MWALDTMRQAGTVQQGYGLALTWRCLHNYRAEGLSADGLSAYLKNVCTGGDFWFAEQCMGRGYRKVHPQQGCMCADTGTALGISKPGV